MRVAVIKYNAGNTASVANALKRLEVEPDVTADPERISSADKVVFPGVGEASTAMGYLRENGLADVIRDLTQPVLGVCLGMQLLCEASEENDSEGLGVIPTTVRRFEDGELPVPHTGWNTVRNLKSIIFNNIAEDEYVYFVHGYYVPLIGPTAATTAYGVTFSSAVQEGNFFGVQFHVEKSGDVGERILKNFLEL